MPDDFTDGFVPSSGVRIAVRDWGGQGTGLILIHGLSRTLIDWSGIAPDLAKTHRVVAIDVRGHGRSDDGPWSWNAAIDDVESVIQHLSLLAPALMGHSLGGMIATMWGQRHPEATGVINLDGHGNPRPDQYVGLDPAWVATKRAELEALQRQQLSKLSGPLSDAQLVALEAQQRALASQFGWPQDIFIEGLHRGMEVRDGETYLRPAVDGLGAEIYASLDEVDMLEVYEEIRCPLLLFNAVDPAGERAAPLGKSWLAELSSAFRRGQSRDLEALAERRPNVTVKSVQGTHGLLFEQPEAITHLTLAFLESSATRPRSE